MKGIAFTSGFIASLLTIGIIYPVFSQITSDNTTNTTVNQNGNNFKIINGIQKGNNLFHSFKEFSIPTGGEAVFNNSTNVVNIINRVTGGNISNIDGLIKASGNANLFLINPKGIVFGENSRLDIGGSFFGSTAESILFEDGFKFSTINPQSEPLLTISAPLGLNIGENSNSIIVNGTGHNLVREKRFLPITRFDKSSGIEINQGNTIALVGNGITLNGGILTSESGKIELASLREGTVYFNQNNQEFMFDYHGVSNFQDIELLEASLIDTSGINSGSIQVKGKNITLEDGSLLWIQNQGFQASGNINVSASELLKIRGNSANENITTSLWTETVGLGDGGDINVSSQKLLLQDNGHIISYTYSPGKGGNLNIKVSDSVKLVGVSSIEKHSSTINAVNYSSGDTGFVKLETKQLSISDGSFIGSAVIGSGNAGDVMVNSSESIEAIGISPIFQPSAISSTTIGTGDAANVIVNTKRLTLQNGGRIDSSTSITGAAGNVTLNASESIELSGIAVGSRNPSLIISSANILDEALRKRFELPDKPFGNSGNLIINTPKLKVTDNALISVRNDGFGDGGNLEINAESINLENRGGITAATESGKGGDIKINLQDSLVMRRGSAINTESLGQGNGGNININSPVIAGFENSDIIANAVEGNGGNIDITTQGIFGLKFRDSLTEESDITASSKFGINGTVKINNISIDPSSGLVELSAELSDSSQQIASGCSSNTGNTFVATGKGGISHNPSQSLNFNHTWSDIRD
ncbi:MAG: S-layer family protein, partial [Cyanobacteria bacterium P01_D01_bin.116]